MVRPLWHAVLVCAAMGSVVAGACGQPGDRPPNPGRDPWGGRIVVRASSDGLAFESAAVDAVGRAIEPDLVELTRDLPAGRSVGAAGERGAILMYVRERRWGERQETISRLVSTDGGATWDAPRPITLSGTIEAGAVVEPSVVQLADGRLRMYVRVDSRVRVPEGPGLVPQPRDRAPSPPQPVPPTHPDPRRPPGEPRQPGPDRAPSAPGAPASEAQRFYSAVSEDGLNFSIEDGVRLEVAGATDADVVRTETGWVLAFRRGGEVMLAHSADGLAWLVADDLAIRAAGAPSLVAMSGGRGVRAYVATRDGVVSARYTIDDRTIERDDGVRAGGPAADCAAALLLSGRTLLALSEAPPGQRP